MISDRLQWIDKDYPTAAREISRALNPAEKSEFAYHWGMQARAEQLPPGGDWRIWLILAGRGFGKTRAGAEWVRATAEACPEARIALVSATLAEARAVMVEGESGIIACSPPERRPVFEASLKRLLFPNGAQAVIYSGQEPESLREPQHSHACRAGAEGVLRQSVAVGDRRFDDAIGGRRAVRTASGAAGWGVLSHRRARHRGLGRTGKPIGARHRW